MTYNVSDWEEKANPDAVRYVYLRTWVVGSEEFADLWIPHTGFGPEACVANIESRVPGAKRIVVTRLHAAHHA